MKSIWLIITPLLVYLSAGCRMVPYAAMPQNFERWRPWTSTAAVQNDKLQIGISRERLRRSWLPCWPAKKRSEDMFLAVFPFDAMLGTNGNACTGQWAWVPVESRDGERLWPFRADGPRRNVFVREDKWSMNWRCDMLVQSLTGEDTLFVPGPAGALVRSGMLDGGASVYGLSDEGVWMLAADGSSWSLEADAERFPVCLKVEREQPLWTVFGEKMALTSDRRYFVHGSSRGWGGHVTDLQTGAYRNIEPQTPGEEMNLEAWGFCHGTEEFTAVFLWGNKGRLVVTDESGRFLGTCIMPVKLCTGLDAEWRFKDGIDFLLTGERHLVFGWVGLKGYPDDYGEIHTATTSSPAFGKYPLGFFLWDWETGIAQLWAISVFWSKTCDGWGEVQYQKVWQGGRNVTGKNDEEEQTTASHTNTGTQNSGKCWNLAK